MKANEMYGKPFTMDGHTGRVLSNNGRSVLIPIQCASICQDLRAMGIGPSEAGLAEIVAIQEDFSNHVVKSLNNHHDLVKALEDMTKQYCDLINSGDAGNWNPETDEPVIKARKVLKETK